MSEVAEDSPIKMDLDLDQIIQKVRAIIMPEVDEKVSTLGQRVENIEEKLQTYEKLNESVENIKEEMMNTSLDRINNE